MKREQSKDYRDGASDVPFLPELEAELRQDVAASSAASAHSWRTDRVGGARSVSEPAWDWQSRRQQ